MTAIKSLVISNGTTKQIPDADSLLVGTGIDRSTAGDLTIGGTTATSITLGSATTPVSIPGDVNTVGGTTFTSDATFEGNVTFGNGPADTVTFAASTTIDSDMNFGGSAAYKLTNMADPTSDQDAATKAYADTKLALTGGTMAGAINMGASQINNLAAGTLGTDAVNLNQLNAVSGFKYDQEIFVAKNGSDVTGTGAVLQPFASITAAMAAITDASPTKRYAIRVEPGAYTEAGALNLKPNVFIVGPVANAVRVTATAFGLDASFTGAGDNRSGFSQMILIGAATFNFATVTSSAGKLYFQSTTFNSAVTLTGYNSSNQAQFDSCLFFGAFTVSGVNVGVHTNNVHFSNIALTQAGAGLPTILVATGGSLGGTLTATTTVNDFNRRISIFARSFWMNGGVTIDGPSSYLDYTVDSLPTGGASTPNGGNLVSIDYGANKALSNLVYPTAVNNPIIPATTNATNMGDWDKQWFFSFSYVYLSSGTDLYIGSAGTSATPDSTGRAVYLQPDQYGLQSNVDGGVLDLRTANATGTGTSGNVDILTGTTVNGNSGDVTITTGTPSGTGTRGVISLDGAEVDVNSVKIVNVANGTNPNDAVNYSQLSAIVSGVSSVTASSPLASSGGATPDISLTGTVAVGNGGTGQITLTSGALVVGNGASAVNTLSPGSNGQVLTVVGGAWAAATPATTSAQGGAKAVQYANATIATDFDGDNAKLAFDEAASQLSIGTGTPNETLTVNGRASLAEGTVPTNTAGFGKLWAGSSDKALHFYDNSQDYLVTPNSVQTLTYAASVALDFDPSLPALKSVALTGDIAFTSSNLGASRNISVRVIGDTVSRNLTSFPAGWTWLGGVAPTVLEANKVAILSLASFSNDNANVVASWSYDGSDVVTDVTASGPLASSGGATPDISFPSWPANASGALTNDGSGNLSWVADAGGTVTSVDVSGGTTGLTTSGGPITGSGTITLAGTLNVANGGTGATSLTSGSLLAGNGTSAVAEIAPGTDGDVLTVVGGAWVSQAVPAAVDYSVVDITTAVSQGDAVTVAGVAAIATAESSARVAGMVSATANKVSVLGIIEDCNFEGSLSLAAGEAVYLSASSAGKLTNVAPSASGEVVAELGIIVTVNTVGGGAAAADVLWQPKSIVVL